MSIESLDEFTLAFIEAALWSTTCGGVPLDQNYSVEDIDPRSLAALVKDCAAFQAHPAYLAMLEADEAIMPMIGNSSRAQLAGFDFWLTRCRYSVGFWDGKWHEPHGSALDKLAKSFPALGGKRDG